MAITIEELNRTLSEDADVLLTAATSADMIKLEQIKAVADGDPQGSPSLIFAPLINSFLNVRGEVSVMLTGVPLDTSDPQNPVYDTVGQRGLDLVLASGLVVDDPAVNHAVIALHYQRVVHLGDSAIFSFEITNDSFESIELVVDEVINSTQEFTDLIENLNATLVMGYGVELALFAHSVSEIPLLLVVNNSSIERVILITYQHGNPPTPSAMLEVTNDPNLNLTHNSSVGVDTGTGGTIFTLTAGSSEAL